MLCGSWWNFAKDLCMVPPALDRPAYKEDEAKRQQLAERKNYVELAGQAEASGGFDNHLSITLDNPGVAIAGLYSKQIAELCPSLYQDPGACARGQKYPSDLYLRYQRLDRAARPCQATKVHKKTSWRGPNESRHGGQDYEKEWVMSPNSFSLPRS